MTKWPNGQRWILAARITTDDGRTGRNHKQLEYSSHNEWYHYPCLLFDGDAAHVAYYYGTNRATHQATRYQKLPKTWFLHP